MKILKYIIATFKKLNKNLTFTYRIFIYNILIILISLSLVSYFSNKISTNAIIQKAEKNSSRELSLIVNNLNSMVDTVNNYSISLSIDKSLQKLLSENANIPSTPDRQYNANTDLVTITTNIIGLNSSITSCNIMSLNGTLYDIGKYENASVSQILNNRFIKKIYGWPKPFWCGPYKLNLKDGASQDVFLIVKAVVNLESGKILGATLIFVKESDLSSIYSNNMDNDHNNFYIIDENNRVISSSTKSSLYEDFNNAIPIRSDLYEKLISDKRLITRINNKQTLIIIHDFEKLNWKVISTVPISEITSENKVINRLIIIIGVLCLIFAFIASFFLSRSISKPLLKLVKIMKSVKQGNMDVRANFDSTDEIGMLGSGFNDLMDRIEVLLNEIYLEQKMKREFEFKLLQSQIKPHFLYNTLETIISFIKLSMPDKAISSVRYLANFYRISLSKGNDIITIGEEIQLTDSYLSIQKLRYTEYIDFKIEVENGILQFMVPKLTLQPLVENAIYHGLKQKNEKGLISIKGYQANDCVHFEVYDNGIGMSQEKIDKILNTRTNFNNRNEDFGINSVDARIKHLYNNDYGIKITSEPGQYTKIVITLPILQGDETHD